MRVGALCHGGANIRFSIGQPNAIPARLRPPWAGRGSAAKTLEAKLFKTPPRRGKKCIWGQIFTRHLPNMINGGRMCGTRT